MINTKRLDINKLCFYKDKKKDKKKLKNILFITISLFI